jgi:hypothetical protein
MEQTLHTVLLQKNANEAEIKKKYSKFIIVFLLITTVPSFDFAFC